MNFASKKVTSGSQFSIMVEFMEQHGDLSKVAIGPLGRQIQARRWRELTELLNSDSVSGTKTEEKWRKVWSDLKNNTKKKVAKINRSFEGTGGSPALATYLSDIEQRVVALMGIQAATGLDNVEKVGFAQVQAEEADETIHPINKALSSLPLSDAEWIFLPTTSQTYNVDELPQPSPSPPPVPEEARSRQPPSKKRKLDAADLFVRCEREAREQEKIRDKWMYELEKERLRQSEIERQERVRQRDTELQLQASWLKVMRDGMRLFERYLNERHE